MYGLRILKHKLWMGTVSLVSKMVKNPRPMVLVGENSSQQLCQLIAGYDVKQLLLVTDKDLENLGLHQACINALEEEGINVCVYSNVSPNPTIEQMQQGIDLAKQSDCDAVLAIGGGSPMDAAKVIAAGVTNAMSISAMEGAFKLKQKTLPLFAIPTTAGTGSEVTVAAVVTDTQAKRKYTVADTKFVPQATALDPTLMVGLPPKVTAATGVDALTHAVEAFISTRANEDVKRDAKIAIKLIFSHLETAYHNGSDIKARQAMAVASYHAGIAIADAGVGYVHAFAHQLGGMYHVPHGLANAVILPYVLDYSFDSIVDELAELAVLIGMDGAASGKQDLAEGFIQKVRLLCTNLALPNKVPEIQQQDIPVIVDRAITEAFDYFAVPKYMTYPQATRFVEALSV
ncbi:iron-containing alcohol dehydrogenase [Maricurvus nonylphenolicus]|uniref:iron-containing alcohol dehydrogenase n=1 Tax=Maricurvus nonylphenolicus TaxID=1008307 RepID=UPI0036F283A6